jgi:hypothetical protein
VARVKVRLADNIARVVFIESAATNGATLGTNLFMPDGSVATAASLRTFIGATDASQQTPQQSHRLLLGLSVGDDHPQYVRKDMLTTRGDLYVRNATVTTRLPLGTAGKVLRSDGTDAAWTGIVMPRGASFQMSDGSVLVTPIEAVQGVRVPYACTIRKVTVLTRGGTGSCVLNIWKDSYANYPPVVGDSICAAAKPTISSGIKYEDATLTGWTTALAAGDTLAFSVESTTVFTFIAIQLDLEGT